MTCPICNAATEQRFRPFCSQHCADIDLGRWFKGMYRTPSFRQDNETGFVSEADRSGDHNITGY